MSGRYLTPAEKAVELERWRDNDGADEGARPLVDRLNALPGVCTVQSCIGHVRQTSEVQRYVESGHVEMRLDEKRTRLFYDAMPALREMGCVEDAVVHWRAREQRCIVWFEPGNMATVVEALLSVFTDRGAEVPDQNPGPTGEMQCL